MSSGKSRCQICGCLCEEEVLDGTNAPRELREADGKVHDWKHSNGRGDHPPYPTVECTKQEAIEDYQKWRKEFGITENLVA